MITIKDFIILFSKIPASQLNDKISSPLFLIFEQKVHISDFSTLVDLDHAKLLLSLNCLVLDLITFNYFVNNALRNFVTDYIINSNQYLFTKKVVLADEIIQSLAVNLSQEDFKKTVNLMNLDTFNKYSNTYNEGNVLILLENKANKKEYFELVQTANNSLINKILDKQILDINSISDVVLTVETIKHILTNNILRYLIRVPIQYIGHNI